MTASKTVPPPGDQATVSVTVHVEPVVAFDVFTKEIDLWWQRGLKFRPGGRNPGALSFEPGLGGRLFETVDIGPGIAQTYVMRRVTAWEPPA